MLVWHRLVEANGAIEALPLQAAVRAHAASAVYVDHIALCLRVAEVGLPYVGLLLLTLFLHSQFVEVSHHVSDGLLVLGYALLQDVEGSREDAQLADDLFEGLCELLASAGDASLIGICYWLRLRELRDSSSSEPASSAGHRPVWRAFRFEGRGSFSGLPRACRWPPLSD